MPKKRIGAELTRRCQTATALTYFKLYRDIFRVLVHKKNNKRLILELGFITPEKGGRMVKHNFDAAVVELVNQHGLRIRIVGM